MVTEQDVLTALRECYDPEIPINVVDLGLIYGVEVQGEKVHVKMTMTFPGCPMHAFLSQEAQGRLLQIPGVKEAEVEIVWDPPWSPELITEEGKKQLGWR